MKIAREQLRADSGLQRIHVGTAARAALTCPAGAGPHEARSRYRSESYPVDQLHRLNVVANFPVAGGLGAQRSDIMASGPTRVDGQVPGGVERGARGWVDIRVICPA